MCPSLYLSCSCAFLCLSSACGWVLYPSAALLAVGLLLVVPWAVVGFLYPSPSLALVGCRGLFPLRGLLGSLGLFGFVILGLWSPVAFDVARGLPCAIFVRCSLRDSSCSKLYISYIFAFGYANITPAFSDCNSYSGMRTFHPRAMPGRWRFPRRLQEFFAIKHVVGTSPFGLMATAKSKTFSALPSS